MNLQGESENYCQPINKLSVVILIVIYILGKARADASEIISEFLRYFIW